MATRKPTHARKRKEAIVSTPELESLVTLVADRFRKDGGAPPYLLNALIGAIRSATTTPVDQDFIESPPAEWEPRTDQLWRPMMTDQGGRRISAWDMFQRAYAPTPFENRPYAHQLRQHPKTKAFYDALCVIVSRNKKNHADGPTSIGDLFPTTPQARGGGLSDRHRGLG